MASVVSEASVHCVAVECHTGYLNLPNNRLHHLRYVFVCDRNALLINE